MADGDSKVLPIPRPAYAPPPGLPPSIRPNATPRTSQAHPPHSNALIQASQWRAQDEQEMFNALQTLQYRYRIYNSEIEPPEHDSDYPCDCPLHMYQRLKWSRSSMQDAWIAAVIYPGESSFNPNKPYSATGLFRNPYARIISPFGPFGNGKSWGTISPSAKYHASWITQTIALNNTLNKEAQANVDAKEPKVSIWEDDPVEALARLRVTDGEKDSAESYEGLSTYPTVEKREKGESSSAVPASSTTKPARSSLFGKLRRSLSARPSEERQVARASKATRKARPLRESILQEERGRWPDREWRAIVHSYQEKTGMVDKVADLRRRQPIQYLHLLRAGYFEPIPVAWADQASNPLKFSIEAAGGWRGITPAWRGYEDTAEERLYWVLNHRRGSTGTRPRLKPDFISALDLARERMAGAVEPPPEYYDDKDTCHVQHVTDGYSKQVMPAPYKSYDRPETAGDDTMILLDVSGSMDFDPQSPNYDRYLVTGFRKSTQPKNKDVAKAIIRRFTDAMQNHDRNFTGYDLTTFSSRAKYIGSVNHRNLDELWDTIHIGGGTRVMTGWQKVKNLHFEKHSESAIHHPVYGWQAGAETPMLRLLLLLDGEATDMDEFELDLMGCSWSHVTIFLIGVDGCPHHHRHANELQRISDVNPHVSFIDAQGNTPERFVTHELLKRHLGYDVTMAEFEDMELPPTYGEAIA